MQLIQDLQCLAPADWAGRVENLCDHVTKSYFEWFMKNWTGDWWELAWRDAGRPGLREGIYNMNNVTEALFKWVMYHFFHQWCANLIQVALNVWWHVMKVFEMKYEQMLVGSYVVMPTVTCANFAECIKAAWAILQEEEIVRVSNMIFTLSSFIILLKTGHVPVNTTSIGVSCASTASPCNSFLAWASHLPINLPH